MNYLKTLITAAAISLAAKAMAQEPTLVNVKYVMSYTRDLADKGNPYIDTMMLSLGEHTARFVSQETFDDNSAKVLDEIRQMREAQSKIPRGTMTAAVGIPMLRMGKYGAVITEEIFTDRKAGKIDVSGRMGFKNYTYSQPLPKITWHPLKDKKVIAGQECQKATGTFGGRNYTAWFTTTGLPFVAGPWKLSGLPGIIMQAADDKNEISFTAVELTRNQDARETNMPYLKRDDAIKVSPADYALMEKRFAMDPLGIVSGQLGGQTIRFFNKDNRADKSEHKVQQYNPIHLK